MTKDQNATAEKSRMSNGRKLKLTMYFINVRPLLKKVYVGLAEGEWKSHFYDHNLSFKHKIF